MGGPLVVIACEVIDGQLEGRQLNDNANVENGR